MRRSASSPPPLMSSRCPSGSRSRFLPFYLEIQVHCIEFPTVDDREAKRRETCHAGRDAAVAGMRLPSLPAYCWSADARAGEGRGGDPEGAGRARRGREGTSSFSFALPGCCADPRPFSDTPCFATNCGPRRAIRRNNGEKRRVISFFSLACPLLRIMFMLSHSARSGSGAAAGCGRS